MRFLIAAMLATSLPAQEPATVISSGKGWLGEGHVIKRGKTLTDQTMLTGGAGDGELILECRRGWVQYVCKGEQPCKLLPCVDQTKVTKAIAVSELGLWAHLSDHLFRREPQEVATLGVRGGGNPSDALLLQDSSGVHWGPALNRVLEGHYCLRVAPLPAGGARTFTIDWDRAVDAEGAARAPSLPAGVYALEKGKDATSGACVPDPDSQPAWVAILPESQFNRANADWKAESARITQIERAGAGPAAAGILRHAALAALFDAATAPARAK